MRRGKTKHGVLCLLSLQICVIRVASPDNGSGHRGRECESGRSRGTNKDLFPKRNLYTVKMYSAIYHDYINGNDARSCTAKPVLNDTCIGRRDVFLWHYLCQRKFINKVILFCFEWYASFNSEQKVSDMFRFSLKIRHVLVVCGE